MRSKLFMLVKYILIFLISILILIFAYETIYSPTDFNASIWTNLGNDSTEYNVSDWKSHVWYLETFEYSNQKIRYIDRWDPNGTPLLLVHGTPTNSRLRRKMIPWLISSWFRVIAPDQFWFWASDKIDSHEELTIEKQSQRLIALMDHLKINTFSIAWHDQWSLWVQETITKIPDRIDHLIIMNSIGTREWFHPPAWFGSENFSTKFSWRAMWSRFFWRIFAYWAMAWWLDNIKFATMNMVNWYLLPLFNWTNSCYYDFITHFDEIEEKITTWHTIFPTLDIPTTIIWGKHDKILVWEEQIPILKKLFSIDESNIHVLENTSHFIQEERPEEIVELIRTFIK